MRCLPFLVGCFFSVAVGADSISARYVRAPAGASGTPPPTRNHTVAVGANIARPRNLTLPINSPGGYRIRPYVRPKGSLV